MSEHEQGRNVVTGKFASKEEVAADPGHTVTESIRKQEFVGLDLLMALLWKLGAATEQEFSVTDAELAAVPHEIHVMRYYDPATATTKVKLVVPE